MIETFQTAISAATNPVMIGFYLGGLMFCLGFVPSVGAKLITVGIEVD